MDKTKRVQQLCRHSKELKGLALDVCSHGRWDMNLPVAVIDARKTPHRFHISAVEPSATSWVSTTADHPLMQQLFELYESRALMLPWRTCSDESGDEFAQLFDTYKEERRLGSPLWSASDAASFVVKSKGAFDDQELAIVALLPESLRPGVIWDSLGVLRRPITQLTRRSSTPRLQPILV